jgi:hypothetical protein
VGLDNYPTKGLRCQYEKNECKIFFSLTDYKNTLFTSRDTRKIVEFFDSFDSRLELIEWMRERPKGIPWIREVEGDRDIIIVVPTADFDGEYARNCREEVFKGQHIVFVESGEKKDFYFNFAHYVNAGIKKAMDYGPKWVIYSGDDVYTIDDISVLKRELDSIDNREYDVVFLKPHLNYSVPLYIGEKRFTYDLLRTFAGRTNGRLYKKYEVKYFYAAKNKLTPLFFKKIRGTDFICTQALGIFSSHYLASRSESLFDETYINEHEDLDMSLQLFLEGVHYKIIDYNIGGYVGGTLGLGVDRGLRQVAGRAYFNWKFENLYSKLIMMGLK